jgi:transposase
MIRGRQPSVHPGVLSHRSVCRLVSRIWRAFGLKPHAIETWKLSTDPEFIGKVRDVVGTYMSPPRAHWCCAWTRSRRSRLIRTAPCLPMLLTTPSAAPTTTSGTARPACSPPTTWPAARSSPSRTAGTATRSFLRFLKLIDTAVPKDLELHLVLDNYATHKTPAIKEWLVKHPRFYLHFTPASSSWLNLVPVNRSVTELETDIRKWINEWNKAPKPFVWTKSADEILEILAAYCQRCRFSSVMTISHRRVRGFVLPEMSMCDSRSTGRRSWDRADSGHGESRSRGCPGSGSSGALGPRCRRL